MALVNYMRSHGGSCGLAVSTGHTQSAISTSQRAEHLSALHNIVCHILEIAENFIVCRNCRSIYHQCVPRVLEFRRNLIGVVIILHLCTLGLQAFGKHRGSFVVTSHGSFF